MLASKSLGSNPRQRVTRPLRVSTVSRRRSGFICELEVPLNAPAPSRTDKVPGKRALEQRDQHGLPGGELALLGHLAECFHTAFWPKRAGFWPTVLNVCLIPNRWVCALPPTLSPQPPAHPPPLAPGASCL